MTHENMKGKESKRSRIIQMMKKSRQERKKESKKESKKERKLKISYAIVNQIYDEKHRNR
jgi:hypothetical protein